MSCQTSRSFLPQLSDFGSHSLIDLFPKIVFFLSAAPDLSDEIFTNFSHEPTWRWYFALTPFEAFFVGIILTQFAVLNLLGIFPLNLGGFVNGMPSGRRKREAPHISQRKRDIASQLLKLLTKLDPDRCTFKAICELEYSSVQRNGTEGFPQSVASILKGLKIITKKREKGEIKFQPDGQSEGSLMQLNIPGINKDEDDVIKLFEEAVKVGDRLMVIDGEASPCVEAYSKCPVTGDEILEYMNMVQSIDDMLQF